IFPSGVNQPQFPVFFPRNDESDAVGGENRRDRRRFGMGGRGHPQGALNLPVECWQPIQGGSARALEFMARDGIPGLVGGGSAEGGSMHRVVLDWKAADAKLGKPIELGERLCFGFHFYMADSREQGMKEAAKYYEENMKMFGELRLVRAITEKQVDMMRD